MSKPYPMFNFLKPGIEFNNLAKAMNGLNVMIQSITPKLTHFDPIEIEEEVLIMAYICRKGILDRLEQYNWPITSMITVPTIEKNRITLAYALQQTIGKVSLIADQIGLTKAVQEIFEKGKSYYEIENSLPSHIKLDI